MVQYNETKLPWAIQPSNIILQIQQEKYHIVIHMSGIVFIHYECQKSEVYTFLPISNFIKNFQVTI